MTVSYSLPSIDYLRANPLLATSGDEEVVLVGINLGPANITFQILAEYGPDGVGICAKECTVLVAHTEIMCTTNEGRGKDHRWTIWVGYGRISLPSVSTTSYGRPVIEQINLFSPSLDTRGGENIEIIGKNFGTSASAWYGCIGTRNVAPPLVTVVYSKNVVEEQVGINSATISSSVNLDQ